MRTTKSAPPELHMFILWHNGISFKDRVIGELSQRGFIHNSTHMVEWPRKFFEENLRRFYAMEASEIRSKVKEIGVGPFFIVTFWDFEPHYALSETSRGFQYVNQRVFDLKADFRNRIFGRNVVHGTNNATEASRDLFMLYGEDYETIKECSLHRLKPKIRLAGVSGWNSVAEILETLNHCDEYVVMRNFAGLPEKLSFSDHGDIDLLTASWAYTKNVLGAVPVFKEDYRRHYYLIMRDGDKIPIDIRSVGDSYYDREWQRQILQNRVLFNGFYVPCEEDHKFSLIYHALIQKARIAPDYTLALTTTDAEKQALTWEDNLNDLHEFMIHNNYNYCVPKDKTVGFDDRFLPSEIRSRVQEIEEFGFSEVVPAQVEAWKNLHGTSYFQGKTPEGQKVFFKCGGIKGSALREYKLLEVLFNELPLNFPQPILYTDDDKNIVAMKFIEGRSLGEMIDRGQIGHDKVRKIEISLLSILDCLQRNRIIHRDIRPENIMVDSGGNVVLIDFQFAISTRFPIFKEYKAVKKRMRQIKSLGAPYALGRYGWDDAFSMRKVIHHLDLVCETSNEVLLDQSFPVGKLTWYGKRNTLYDFLRFQFTNFVRSKLLKKQ